MTNGYSNAFLRLVKGKSEMQTMPRSIYELSAEIMAYYAKTGKWRKVAEKYGITTGLAYRIAHECYEPKSPHLRLILHLPALAPAPVCVKCGNVHTTKRCIRRRVRWSDTPIQERPDWLNLVYLALREECDD